MQQYNAYVFANVDKNSDFVEIGASTLDGKKSMLMTEVTEGLAAYSLVEWRLNMLAGRILTQCDAAFSDPVQRKAFKDEIRSKFSEEFGFYSEHLLRSIMSDFEKKMNKMSDKDLKKHLKKGGMVDIADVIAPGK